MALSPIAEAFSVSHAQILSGTDTFLQAIAKAAMDTEDIYGVSEASLEPDVGDYDNEGDDSVLSSWSWINKAELTVQAGYISFPLIAALTGQTMTSSTSGGKESLHLDLWHEDSMNVAPKPMIVKMPSKDRDGAPADFVFGLYRVNFKPITFEGPAYKDGLKVNYDGIALASSVDEKGVKFADGKKRFGKLLLIQR